MVIKEKILPYIEAKREMLLNISDSIWEYAEPKFAEYKSSALLCQVLAEEGFAVTKGIAGMETAFVASYGSGKPVIAFLGEYDAQYGLSQEAGAAERKPLLDGGPGHGCGHHTIGVGALAAAFAVKEYIKEHEIKGTVKYFGCPGAEGGCGKVYLARAGYFNHVEAALTWHPFTSSNIMTFNVLATISAYFKFQGVSSHAAGSPHLGRSALDAVELMNAGVNFLREHVEQDVRMHYAITDAGGCSPNVVQAKATVLQQIRAPRLSQVRDIYERVVNIAKGAALMTDTKLEVVFDKASSNVLLNNVLGALVHEKFRELGPVPVNEQDLEYARKIRKTMSEKEKRLDEFIATNMFGEAGKMVVKEIEGKEIIDLIYPYNSKEIVSSGSNDLGDVSWNVPTVAFQTVTFAKDTAPQSWQMVAQGKSDLCHKGLLHAGKVLALAGAELLENPKLFREARNEFDQRRAGETYRSPIPPEVKPSTLYKKEVQ
ncbi:amidohydrolase [Desulfitobacterium sp. THU1]|uniref:amidohydrolase n=1 Tax=Desulfitobacterium sp. THU1 TaxID=3138072 RepID=UPI00311FD373